MQAGEIRIEKVRVVVRDLINSDDLSDYDEAVKVMHAILSTAAYAPRYTLLVIDFASITGMDERTATPLCTAMAGIVNTDWEVYFALSMLTNRPSRFILRERMVASYLVAAELTDTTN